MNLCSLLKRTSRAYPDNIAIIKGDEQIAYRELWERIESLSNGFLDIDVAPLSFLIAKSSYYAFPACSGSTQWQSLIKKD